MTPGAEGSGRGGGGFFDSVRQLAQTAVGLLQTRLEIIVTELEEERLRVRQFLFLGLLAAFCLGLAVLLAVTFVVVVFWDTHRLAAIGGLFIVFLGAGSFAAARLARRAAHRGRLFDTTLTELAKDRDRLARRS